MDDLSGTVGIVALCAAGLAFVSFVLAIVLAVRLRRVRAAQRVVLGESAQDLVDHAATLQEAFAELHDRVEEVAERLDERMAEAEGRLDRAISFSALVRYDAYNELSGHQSTSLALLDAERNGLVLSSIAHRDNARLYCKQVTRGRGELELSPEEAEAVRLAFEDTSRSVTLD